MNKKAETCLKHKRHETEAAAWWWAGRTKRNLHGDYRAWKCGDHWHIGKSRRSIWAVFGYIEQERKQRGKVTA